MESKTKKELFEKGLKQCSICDVIKTVESFYRRASSKYGLFSACKCCYNKRQKICKQNKAINEKKRQLKKQLYDSGLKECSKCKYVKILDAFGSTKGKKASACKICCNKAHFIRRGATIAAERKKLKSQGLKKCSKCKVIKPFSDYHMQSKAENIPAAACKTCYRASSPFNKATSYTIEQCHEVALLYKHRGKFASEDKNIYLYAHRRGWLDKICTHMTPARRGGRGGWRKSEYIDLCSDKKVEPIIYLLKCWDEEESFYKIGITSLSVSKRYHRPENMPYDYEILWELRGDAELIWELEYSIKRATKKHRYRPFVKFDGSTHECFKCHGNCSILKIPKGLKVSP